jgi:hypothetical protein
MILQRRQRDELPVVIAAFGGPDKAKPAQKITLISWRLSNPATGKT